MSVLAVAKGAALAAVALTWVVCLVRLLGPRALSKMTPFDFVVTLAVASLLASAAMADTGPAFWQALGAIGMLFAGQHLLAWGRLRFPALRRLIENDPVLLVRDGRILPSALRAARISEDDIRCKLRQADVGDLASVTCAILETTGDLSVMKAAPSEGLLSDLRESAAPAG